MIHFLAPGALAGLLALALPVVLHLRRPPPPTVRVGSLRHLDAQPRRRRRWWRWRDRARLALRLALLTLLTLALARAFWRPPEDRSPRHWSLVDPAGTPAGPSRERLDARRVAGDEIRFLAAGFPAVVPSGNAVSAPAPVDVWSLLRELDARLPAGSALTVFTPARLESLRSERPTLGHVTVEMVETPPARELPRATPGPSVVPAGREVHVLIFHAADRAGDARRLGAAIRAAAGAPGGASRPGVVVLVNPGSDAVPAAPDWVFCLGGPRPEVLAEAAGITDARNLFTDAGDAPPTAEDETPPGPLVAPELAGGPDLLVRRRAARPSDDDPAAAVHWTDGVGRPVLTVARTDPGGRRRWRFNGRLDPAWNDLPATTALAEVLRAWLFPGAVVPPADDPRRAGVEQARPREGPATVARPAPWPWSPDADDPAGATAVDLRPWALALAAAGFLLERLWSWRRRVPGTPRPATVNS